MVWIHTEYTLWYPPSNSDQQDYYNLTFLVRESLFTLAFDSDWVGRIDPRSNLEAPFCPWGGFPEALQSLLCYCQVLDKFLFSQPTSDSFIGYEGNNASPASHQSNPPQQCRFCGNSWSLSPIHFWLLGIRGSHNSSRGQFGLCTTAAGWRGHGHGAPELGLVAWDRTDTPWFEGSQRFIHQMCVPEGIFENIYLAGASLPQSLVSCLIQGYATMTCCAFWCMAIPGEAQP